MRPRRVGDAPPLTVANVLARRMLVLGLALLLAPWTSLDHRGDRSGASFGLPVVRVAECAKIKGLGRVLEAVKAGKHADEVQEAVSKLKKRERRKALNRFDSVSGDQ